MIRGVVDITDSSLFTILLTITENLETKAGPNSYI